jgi:hypothetical protein
MLRTVSAGALSRSPFALARGRANAFVRDAQCGGPASTLSVTLRILGMPLQQRVDFIFGFHAHAAGDAGELNEIRINWDADAPALQDFCGSLRFRRDGLKTGVIVTGTYEVPAGLRGRVLFAFGGEDMAQSCVRHIASSAVAVLDGTPDSHDAEPTEHPGI